MDFSKTLNQFQRLQNTLRGQGFLNEQGQWTKTGEQVYQALVKGTGAGLSTPPASSAPSVLSQASQAQDLSNRGADANLERQIRSAQAGLDVGKERANAGTAVIGERTGIADESYRNRMGYGVDSYGRLMGQQHEYETGARQALSDDFRYITGKSYALQERALDAGIDLANKPPSFISQLGQLGQLAASIMGGLALLRG